MSYSHRMKALPAQYDQAATEKKWQRHWTEQKTYAWMDDDAPENARDNSYVIDTPPPTVSGTLHMGHVFSYTQADFIARFQRMTGKNVFYPMGFDDNGLPTERLVEKVKKIRAVDMSREAFIAECLGVSEEARKEFRALFESIALSVDWDQEYHTISDDSRRLSQLSFLDLVKKNQAYRALRPFYWDPVDQTAIASAEIEDKELPSFANDITFMAEGQPLTIMTTRPELLPACVALFCHPEDARYTKLIGKQADVPLFGFTVPILADDTVEMEKGTGLMMCCTFGDDADIAKWQKHQLPTRVILNKFGKIDSLANVLKKANYQSTAKIEELIATLSGKKVSNTDPKHPGARQIVIAELEAAGLLVAKKPITHAVKCAERSGAPLEILPTHQWFVRVTDKKDALTARARECNWNPEWMRLRIEQWIEGLNQDWCISRQRYFGVPFPVWYSLREGEVGKAIYATPEQLPVNPLVDLPQGYSREEVTADADVMDTWATSSISPQLSAGAISETDSNDSYGINPPRLRGGRGGTGRFGEHESSTRHAEAMQHAKSMRQEMTPAEFKLWEILAGKKLDGYKFRRQQSIGKYIVDFVCMEKMLVIEIDGETHADAAAYDAARTEWLNAQGYQVLRYTNNEVRENLEGIATHILQALQRTPPSPPQAGGLEASRFAKLYPADLRPQAHEIIRTWAFYTLVKSHLHSDSIPWKNLMISGWCLAEDKSKMSKSKGNVVTPTALIEEKGTDAVRYWAATSRLGQDTAFSPDLLKIGKKLIGKLWNATQFASIHLAKLGAAPLSAREVMENGSVSEILDRWILSRLGETVNKATAAFNAYEYAVALEETNQFFWADFCDNYLELIKKRVYNEDGSFSPAQQQSAVMTLYHCLLGILQLYAPFVPHVTEELYSHIFAERYESTGSLHGRGNWPRATDYTIEPSALGAGAHAVAVLEIIRKEKSESNRSIKYPIRLLQLAVPEPSTHAAWLADVMGAGNVVATETVAKTDAMRATPDGAYALAVTFAAEADAA